jgi:hypothetical protein
MSKVRGSVWPDEQVERARKVYAKLWDYYADPTLGFIRFLNDCVYTKDEEADVDSGENPVKKFPINKSYIEYGIKNIILRERLIAIAKSRRMIATWMVAAYCVWFAMFKETRNVLWQAQTGKKSANTLEEKMLFILENLPEDKFAPFVNITSSATPAGWDTRVLNYYRPKRSQDGLVEITFLRRKQRMGTGEEYFVDDSTIYGISEGADQWRQYTVSLGVADEFAFWENPAASLKGARPAVGTKGQLILLSSANPGYMQDVIRAPVFMKQEVFKETGLPFHPGIKSWRSQMGYFVWWLHYTADEEKRDSRWTTWEDDSDPDAGLARQGYDRKQWNQEMEIDFSVHLGEPFYPEYSDNLHKHRIRPIPDIPVILGFDFGLTPATTFFQVTPTGHVLCLAEVISTENGIVQHLQDVIAVLNQMFPWWNERRKKPKRDLSDWLVDQLEDESLRTNFREMIISYCDPAGFQRAQTDMTSPIQILKEHGLNPVGGYQDPVIRMEAVKKALTTMRVYQDAKKKTDVRLPVLLIDPSCEKAIEGFQGGCKVSKTRRFSKEKNEFSHVIESIEYPMSMLFQIEKKVYGRGKKLPPRRQHIQRFD